MFKLSSFRVTASREKLAFFIRLFGLWIQEMRKSTCQYFCWTVLVYDGSNGSLGPICLMLIFHHSEDLLDKKLATLSISSTAVHRQAEVLRRHWALGAVSAWSCCYHGELIGATRQDLRVRPLKTPIKWRALTLAKFGDIWETWIPPAAPILLLTYNSLPHMPKV